MLNLHRAITRLVLNEKTKCASRNGGAIPLENGIEACRFIVSRAFSVAPGGGGGDNDGRGDDSGKSTAGTFGGSPSEDQGWDSVSSWSTGLTKEHFDGEISGHRSVVGATTQSAEIAELQDADNRLNELEEELRTSRKFVNNWPNRMQETCMLLRQVREPGARGSYLKDSEKAEMYRLHKENPEVYTVERLAKDYRIMRQRVHAILYLKQDEEEMEKKLGYRLDDSVEQLLDNFPEFFISHDREFHVASLPYKPDFKVMPEGWDGTPKDMDEVHYEISKKEDDMLYKDFLLRFEFNKKKMAGDVFSHKYSRRRPSAGWNFTVEKLGPRGKRGGGGGWKFVSQADGSSRQLNEMEKLYVRRETPRRRRRILPPFKHV